MIKDILNRDGELKKLEDYPHNRRPVYYENTVIESTMKDFINSCQYTCGRTHEGCIREIGTEMWNFNAYGRIVHKKTKGCSSFYRLLNFDKRKNGWDKACRGMERDLSDFDPNYCFDSEAFYTNVKKIVNLNYFNRIKQFMLRMYRNNLYLGVKGKKTQKVT